MSKISNHEKPKQNTNIDNVKREIEEYKHLLAKFKITFQHLTTSSPKDIEIKKNAMKTAQLIAAHENLSKQMMTNKKLPIKELKSFSICPKFIRSHKRYILALALIYIGKFTSLKNYIDI